MNIGYHFAGDTLRDGRLVPADGEWLTHHGPTELSLSGLSWSKTAFDALKYARGVILCRVECRGVTWHYTDHSVALRRKIIARIDATELLRGFARWQAHQCLQLWNPDPIVVEFINTGNEALRIEAHASASDSARNMANPTDWDWALASAINSANASKWVRECALSGARTSAKALANSGEKAFVNKIDMAITLQSAADDFQLLVDIAFDNANLG